METGDEFDNGNASPVPPHERAWRHPAEVHDANRRRVAVDSTPPPVSRRTRSIIILIGACATVVLFAVALPVGMQPEPDQVSDSPDATSAPQVTLVTAKGSAQEAARLRGVAFADGWFAVASDLLPDAAQDGAASPLTVVTPDRSEHGARHMFSVEALGLEILSSSTGPGRCDFQTGFGDDEIGYLLRGGSLSVIDSSGGRHPVRNSITSGGTASATVPVDVEPIDGAGVLVAFDDTPVGLVSVVRGSTYALLLPGLADVTCGA
ncbi:MAG: hypothetical protein ACKO1X_06105 [Acidimicrobiales bacterium]